ncbi:MAG: ABC transporter substrate-binding protein [Thermodesulfobacteriota bacterium]
MSKKLLLASVTFLVTLGFILAPSWGAEKVRLATHFKVNPHYGLPAWAAMDQGYWRQMGLKVEWTPFRSSKDMLRGVLTRDIDMGTFGVIALVRVVSRGAPLVAVGDSGSTSNFYFWVLTDSPLKKPQDLKGTKIGVTRLGGSSHTYAQAVIKALGLEGQVKFHALGGGMASMAGLRSGAIDVTNLSDFSMAALKVRGIVRELVTLNDYLPKGLATQIIFSRKDFLSSNPDSVRKIVAGWNKGAEFVMNNKKWAIEKMKEGRLSSYNDEGALAAYRLLRYDDRGKIAIVKIQNARKFLINYGLLAKDKAAPLEAYYAKGYAK